jgi:predicted nucleotidyltransferase
MQRNDVLNLLKEHLPEIQERFHVQDLAVFGSFVRGQAGLDSDVDVLVAFDGRGTSDRYFGLQFYLEDLLGRPVDLVTDRAVRPELRPFIEDEAVHVR